MGIMKGMSFFYLTPVKGDLPIDLLKTIVAKRLEFLKALFLKQNIVYNEYVLEGSVYDAVGHYMLCIIVILANNSDFKQFFIKAEESLFRHRLKTLAAYDLRCFAKKLLRIIRKNQINLHYFHPLNILCQHLILKHITQHICSEVCCDDCSLHFLKVHFKHCLTFIAKRHVELRHGIAFIPCNKWKSFLTILFIESLKHRLGNKNLNSLQSDPRIADLIIMVRKDMLILNNQPDINILRSNEVDNLSRLFPPCMLNLHQQLRNKHRLSHNQRFSYSLFLKDIGMTVEEATTFWRTEYQQAPNGKHQCCHNWKNDEKKFVYGIRHLYGLEGGRKSYSFGSCHRMQSSDSSCAEGGCPFKSFDNETMLQILDIKKTNPLLSQIKNLQQQKQYTSACMLYLQNKFNFISNTFCDRSFNFSPVKYYLYTSKHEIL